MGKSENSSDTDVGRRPKLKSAEFSDFTPNLTEIQPDLCEIMGKWCFVLESQTPWDPCKPEVFTRDELGREVENPESM